MLSIKPIILEQTIRPVERMIPAELIIGECMAILLLFLIGLAAASVFSSTGKGSM